MAMNKSPKTARRKEAQGGNTHEGVVVEASDARFFCELMLHLNSRRSQISMSALAAHPEHTISLALVRQSLSPDSCAVLDRMPRQRFNAVFGPHVTLGAAAAASGEIEESMIVRSRSVLAFNLTFFRYHADFSMLPIYLDLCGAKGNPHYNKKQLTKSPVDFLGKLENAHALSSACRAVMEQYPVFDSSWVAYLKNQHGCPGPLDTIERLDRALKTFPPRIPTKLVDCVVNALHAILSELNSAFTKVANVDDGTKLYSQLDKELNAARPEHLEILEDVRRYIEEQGITSKQRTSMHGDYTVVKEVLTMWFKHKPNETAAKAKANSTYESPAKKRGNPSAEPPSATEHDAQSRTPPATLPLPPPEDTPPSVRKSRLTNGIDPDLLFEAAGRPPPQTFTIARNDPRLQRRQAQQDEPQRSTPFNSLAPQLQPVHTAVPAAAGAPTDPRMRSASTPSQAPPPTSFGGLGDRRANGNEMKSDETAATDRVASSAKQNRARPASVAFEDSYYSGGFDPDLPSGSLHDRRFLNSSTGTASGAVAAADGAFGQPQRQRMHQEQATSVEHQQQAGATLRRQPVLKSALKQPARDESRPSESAKRRKLRKHVRFQANAPKHIPDPSTGWLSVNEYKKRERTSEKSDLARSEDNFSKGQFAKGSLAARMDRAIWCVFQGDHSLWDSIFALIENGVDPNFGRPVMGETALLAAAFLGRRDEVEKLLQLGANPAQADKNGATPALLASRKGHTELAQYLASLAAEQQSAPKKRRMLR